MITCPTGQTVNIDTTKFLPDMGQADFLKAIINTFNLYFTIDVNNKTINFETYDVMFTNKVNPYDVSEKVMSDTLSIETVDNGDASINFKAADNMKVLGDNNYLASSGTTINEVFRPSDENVNKKVFNHIGTSTNSIDIPFGVPAIKRMYLRNEIDYAGSNFNAGDHIIYIPNISKQSPVENDNKLFNKKDTDTNVYNTEDSIQHKGSPTLYYYYGLSSSALEQKGGVGSDSNYYYVNLKTTHQKFGIVSPFIYMDYRDNINDKLNNPDDSVDSVLASYVQTPYLMLGEDTTKQTKFSLIFSDNADYGETLFTKFYKNKYDRYGNSYLLKFNMLMNNLDWLKLQPNQPVKFLDQIYSLVSITNYDVVKGVGEVTLIKMI